MMKRSPFSYVVLMFSFLMTTGCWATDASLKNPIPLSQNEPMIVLFSDENSMYEEANYYDALLEIQRRYPESHIPFQFVYSSNKDATKYFDILTYPTLIVLDKKDQILLRLDEPLEKDDIVNELIIVTQIDKEGLSNK